MSSREGLATEESEAGEGRKGSEGEGDTAAGEGGAEVSPDKEAAELEVERRLKEEAGCGVNEIMGGEAGVKAEAERGEGEEGVK